MRAREHHHRRIARPEVSFFRVRGSMETSAENVSEFAPKAGFSR
jgi:hypothetical protein